MILEGIWSGVLVGRFLVRGKAMFWPEMSQWGVEYPDVFPEDVYDFYFVGAS